MGENMTQAKRLGAGRPVVQLVLLLSAALAVAACGGGPSGVPLSSPSGQTSASAGAPMGALGLVVTGSFVPGSFARSTPPSFSAPGGGIVRLEKGLRGNQPTMLARVGNWLGQLVNHGWNGAGPREALAATTGFIAVYAPLGSWSQSTKDVALIPIAGSGVTGGVVSTPNVVNSCAAVSAGTFVSGSTNPEAVCVANGTDIYLIDGTTIVKTLTSGGVSPNLVRFSGGQCTTCGVVVDALSGNAVISVATATDPTTHTVLGGYQLLNLSTLALSKVIGMGPADGIAEHFSVLPVSSGLFLLLSPPEDDMGTDTADYDIVAIAPPSASSVGGDAVLDFASRASYLYTGCSGAPTELDTAAVDSTGIIYAQDECTGNLFLADLMQATTATSTAPYSWNVPAKAAQFQALTELSTGDMNGLAVAFGAHEALTEEEFDGNAFGAIKLPSTSGSGTPAASDWVLAAMPNDPSGAAWANPLDPHGLTAAFASAAASAGAIIVGSPRGWGLLMNNARTYVAVIDLDALLAAPREAAPPAAGSHTVSASYDLVKNNVVTFVKFP